MFGPEVLFIALFRAVIFYGGIIALIVGTVFLLNGKRAKASGWLVVGALVTGFWTLYWLQTYWGPASRSFEVASWTRTVPSAAERPRTLTIYDSKLKLQPYAFYLAETGLFDIHVVQGHRYSPPADRKVWRLEVGERDDCKETRKERDELVVRNGWRTCAAAVPALHPPAEGLALYTNGGTAPHSWMSTRKTFDTGEAWTLELGWRTGTEEKLVDFNEYLTFAEVWFHPAIGPMTRPRDPPRDDGYIAAPDPARFTLLALGIDLQPQPVADPNFHRNLMEHLSSTGHPDDTQRALDMIAAGDRDETSRAAVVRLASGMNTAMNMQLKRRGKPAEVCEKIAKLNRFRDELIKGCNVGIGTAEACGLISHPAKWLATCADNSLPIWRSDDPPARRVFLADIRGGDPTKVTLSKPARVIEIRVPGDRGPIDLAMRNGDPRVFAFTGATSCITRLTVLEHADPATGIFGIARSRLRFAKPTGTGNWINPQAPFASMKDVLGARPDLFLLDHEGVLDLAEKLSALSSAQPCPPDGTGRSQATPKPTDVLRINVEDILTAPPLLPLLRAQ